MGAALQASDLGFSKGMVQLEFMQGHGYARGSSQYEVGSHNAMELRVGKLRAHVPKVGSVLLWIYLWEK